MIEYTRGDLLRSDADALVNPVNCVGVMGKGLALQFRKAFPENFREYKVACNRDQLHPGMMLVHTLSESDSPRYIINFPTKRHWKEQSRMKDIRSGLDALISEVRERNIKSIAIPPLGCGLGGLDWNNVRPLIEGAFHDLPAVRAILYEPGNA